jgi:hypothetical protein
VPAQADEQGARVEVGIHALTGTPFEGARGGGGSWAWGEGVSLAGSYRDWPVSLGLDINFTYFGTLRGRDQGGTARRRAQVFLGDLFLRLQPVQWRARPYLEGVVGFKSVTDIYTVGAVLPDPDYTTNGKKSLVHTVGVGAGVELEIDRNESSRVFLTLGVRWLHGGDVASAKRVARQDDVSFVDAKYATTTTVFTLGAAAEF